MPISGSRPTQSAQGGTTGVRTAPRSSRPRRFASGGEGRLCLPVPPASFHIAPGKPVRSVFGEGFGGRNRDECLNAHLFSLLAEAGRIIENWWIDDDTLRLRSSLGGVAPSVFANRSDQGPFSAEPLGRYSAEINPHATIRRRPINRH